MPELVFSDRFADDLAAVTSPRVESSVMTALNNIEAFAEFGSSNVPASIATEFGPGVRKVVTNPFDLVYTLAEDGNIAYTEALIHQRAAR